MLAEELTSPGSSLYPYTLLYTPTLYCISMLAQQSVGNI